MSSFMTKSLALAFFCSAMLFSNVNNCSDLCKETQGHILSNDILCAYNSSGRIEVKSSWEVYIEGSYILWQTKENGLDLGLVYPDNSGENVSVINQDFNYNSGFKVSVCSNFDHDSWQVLVEYVRLHTKAQENHTAKAGTYILPSKMFYSDAESGAGTSNHASYIKESWRLKYDVIDFEIKRPCYIGTHLIFKPHFGARGGWIAQRLYSTADFTNLNIGQTDPITTYAEAKLDTWLIGPRTGLDCDWILGNGVKLLTNLAASLTYQKFLTRFMQDNYHNINLYDKKVKDHIGYLMSNLDLGLGFSWGRYFDNNNWHVQLTALYDFLLYFGQNKVRQVIDLNLREIEGKPSNLFLHGLTASLRFDF